ncbi:hypothetical protein A2U01_0104854, partial [Trifolium medium]|nr:hypothetical protein [Trifolium medium]
VLSSTGSEVDSALNGVAAKRKEAAEESIVAAVSINAEKQQDGDVDVHTLARDILSDTMIPATHKLAQPN